MEPLRKASIGGVPFMRLRESGKLYVDKSMLIADLLETDDEGVYLFTRPRRFGKSTNITMLDAFFNLEYDGNDWFDDLEISEHPEYDCYKNAFPVVYIDLKDIVPETNSTYDGFIRKFRIAIRNAFLRFRYLLECDDIPDDDRNIIRDVLYKTSDNETLQVSVSELCRILQYHHGRNVIVLIDEYDRAVTDTFRTDMQSHIVEFLGHFMSATLKGNQNLQMAYVTGIMQVAKAGMFSGANNFYVNTVFSKDSDERFGFTEKEVKDILGYYGHPEKFSEIKKWYDGYRFGNADVYNPFSVMSYIVKRFTPDSYWANSGKDTALRWMVSRTDADSLDALANLVSGASIISGIQHEITYEEMVRSESTDLYSHMVMTGYLRAEHLEGNSYLLSIPNDEVMGIVDGILKKNLRIDDGLQREFCLAVLDGDVHTVESTLEHILDGGDYLNLVNESAYQLVLMTMMRSMLREYDVRTERRGGNGRIDIILTPVREGVRPMVMKLKLTDSEARLEQEAEDAIAQIHRMRYYHGMTGEVMLYGMAFRGVLAKVVLERIALRGEVKGKRFKGGLMPVSSAPPRGASPAGLSFSTTETTRHTRARTTNIARETSVMVVTPWEGKDSRAYSPHTSATNSGI